jgi:HK97 family phage prohead protease
MQRIEVKFAAEDVTAKGEFAGYGAVFGNIDSHGDAIARGAFSETLKGWKSQGKLPPMLLQHGLGFTDGDGIPVGKWTAMREDEKGLYAEGKLINMDTERGRTIYGALSEGVLDGLSIGYRAKKFSLRTKPDEPRRTLEALDLFELSIVTFPSNGSARIEAVKSAAQEMKTIREFEDFLRDVGGFSHAQAKAIASHGFKAADPRDEDDADLVALLRRNIEALSA